MRLSFLKLPGHERRLFFGSRGHITTPLALARFACCPAMSVCRSCVATQALKALVGDVVLQKREGDTIVSLAYDRKAAAHKAAKNRDGAT
jgi:hypothetical protein